MTISSTTNRVSYSGNGVTKTFSFPYKFLDSTDLVVYLRNSSTGAETLQAYLTQYTVSGAGETSGGSVAFVTAPASGYSVVIYRDPALLQPANFVTNDGLPAETLEQRLDSLVLMMQRLNERISRALHLSDANTQSIDVTLPGPLQASYLLQVNSGATGFALAAPTSVSVGAHATSHANAGADRVTVVEAQMVLEDNTTANVSSAKHGLTPKISSADGTHFLCGLGTWVVIGEDVLAAALTDITTADATASAHGLCPKLSNASNQFLNGLGQWAVPAAGASTDADISFSDITTNDASAAKHGFLPKLSGSASQYLDGSGSWSIPSVGSVSDTSITMTDVTTNNASTLKHGFCPKLTNEAGQFLNGQGNFSAVTEATLNLVDVVTNNASTTAHGFLKKLSGDTDKFLDGSGTWSKIPETALLLVDTITGNASTGAHGLLRKLSNNASQYLDGQGNWTTPSVGSVSDSSISFTDITTNNSSTSKHGFLPKLSNNTSEFLNGQGLWATPSVGAVSDSAVTFTDITTNNASASKHGFLPKLSAVSTQFLNGGGSWAQVAESDLSVTDITTNNVSTSKHGLVPKAPNSALQFLRGDAAWASTPPSLVSGGYVTRESTNLVLTPSASNRLWLYESGNWVEHIIPNNDSTDNRLKIACTGYGAPDFLTLFYLYVWDNAGTLELELSKTAPVLQDGILVKSGATSRLLLARCRTNGSGAITTFADDPACHLVVNIYNRRRVFVYKQDTTATWTYNTPTWRYARGDSTNKVGLLLDGITAVKACYSTSSYNGSTGSYVGSIGVGLDGETIAAGSVYSATSYAPLSWITGVATYVGVPASGYHDFTALEYAASGGATTFYGSGGSVGQQAMMIHAEALL